MWVLKICIHRASTMLKIFLKENCEFSSAIWVKWKQPVCSIIILHSSTFCSLFLLFFVLKIFYKFDKFFVRYSASISIFKCWFKQLCTSQDAVKDVPELTEKQKYPNFRGKNSIFQKSVRGCQQITFLVLNRFCPLRNPPPPPPHPLS